MLHMVVKQAHCRELCLQERGQLRGDGGRRGGEGATLHGAWANMASHTIFAVFDAPNSHVVDELLRETGLVGYTESHVYSV